MNNNNYPLPLLENSRPMFECLDTMERLCHIHSNNLMHSFDFMKACSWLYNIRFVRSCLESNYQNNVALGVDAFLVLKELNLFAPLDCLMKWEHERAYQKSPVYSEYIASANEILDGGSPSQLYQYNEQWQKELWNNWIMRQPYDELFNILTFSESVWSAWLSSHPLNKDGVYAKALQPFQSAFSLSDEQLRVWTRMEEWLHSHASTWIRHYCIDKLHTKSETIHFATFAYVFNTDIKTLDSLFGANGILVKKGLYKPLTKQRLLPLEKTDTLDSWKTSLWKDAFIAYNGCDEILWETLFEKIVSDTDKDVLLVSEEDCNVLHSALPQIVVLYGTAGSGKKTALTQLLKSTSKTGYLLKNAEKDGLLLGKIVAETDPSAVLVVNNKVLIETAEFKQMLCNLSCHVIVQWSSALDELNALVGDRIHHIIDLEQLPYTNRLLLAEKFFKNADVARKVARICKKPIEIVRMEQLCQRTNDYSFETLQKTLAPLKKIQSSNVSFVTVLDNEDKTDLPPLAPSKKWDELFDKLSRGFVNFEKCKQLGVSPPKGAILLGPPGTGKTLFARHLASRLDVSCLSVDCSKVSGNVKEMFEVVRSYAPCVVILDEADPLIIPDPTKADTSSLAFTSQLDGVKNLDGVLFIATSNCRRFDIHPPIMRSGRLSEVHQIRRPQTAERADIWTVYLEKQKLDVPLDEAVVLLNRVSRGFTGADIKEVLRQALENLLDKPTNVLSIKDLLAICDGLAWGNPTGLDTICPKEKWSIAIHEAGHALLAWRANYDVYRITIRYRDNALGSVSCSPKEGLYRQSKMNLAQDVQLSLGGIAAEMVVFNAYETGGSSDLARVRSTLQDAFAHLGLGYAGPLGTPNGYGQEGVWTERRREEIELECRHWAKDLFDQTVQWLSENRDLLEKLAKKLLEDIDLSIDELLPFEQEVQSLKDDGVRVPQWGGVELFGINNTSIATGKEEQAKSVAATLHKDL